MRCARRSRSRRRSRARSRIRYDRERDRRPACRPGPRCFHARLSPCRPGTGRMVPEPRARPRTLRLSADRRHPDRGDLRLRGVAAPSRTDGGRLDSGAVRRGLRARRPAPHRHAAAREGDRGFRAAAAGGALHAVLQPRRPDLREPRLQSAPDAGRARRARRLAPGAVLRTVGALRQRFRPPPARHARDLPGARLQAGNRRFRARFLRDEDAVRPSPGLREGRPLLHQRHRGRFQEAPAGLDHRQSGPCPGHPRRRRGCRNRGGVPGLQGGRLRSGAGVLRRPADDGAGTAAGQLPGHRRGEPARPAAARDRLAARPRLRLADRDAVRRNRPRRHVRGLPPQQGPDASSRSSTAPTGRSASCASRT